MPIIADSIEEPETGMYRVHQARYGHVDPHVINYEDWKDNTYPFPDLLFRNLGGDKGFKLWREAKGEQVMPGRGVTFLDVDEDGKTEIYVSNYRLAPNFL